MNVWKNLYVGNVPNKNPLVYSFKVNLSSLIVIQSYVGYIPLVGGGNKA